MVARGPDYEASPNRRQSYMAQNKREEGSRRCFRLSPNDEDDEDRSEPHNMSKISEPPKEPDEEVLVWDVVGELSNSQLGVFRFGAWLDRSMFKVMRWIATIDSIWIPFLVSFGQLSAVDGVVHSMEVIFLDSMLSLVYCLGVLIQLHTSYVNVGVGQEYVSHQTIAVHRLQSATWWCDFLSCIGTPWWHSRGSLFVAVARILRIWRLSSGADDLYELHLAELTSEDAMRNLLELLLSLLLVMHNFACAWFFAATRSGDDWEYKLQHDPRVPGLDLPTVYLSYFSQGAEMLAGWSGPEPFNPEGYISRSEMMVWAIAAPSAALCNAMIFAQLLEVVKQASAMTRTHLERMAALSLVLDSLFVPASLKVRCLRYHSFLSIHKANRSEYEDLFAPLGKYLQEDIKVHLFNDLVRTAPFFRALPDEVMAELVVAFEEQVFGPREYIVRRGDLSSEVYFVMKGSCEVIAEDRTTLAVKRVGDYFGEIGLIMETPRTASVRAKTFCIVARLDRASFDRICADAPLVRDLVVDQIRSLRSSKDTRPNSPSPPTSARHEYKPLLKELTEDSWEALPIVQKDRQPGRLETIDRQLARVDSVRSIELEDVTTKTAGVNEGLEPNGVQGMMLARVEQSLDSLHTKLHGYGLRLELIEAHVVGIDRRLKAPEGKK
eukprot:TRINITY_DN74447_c0_g1_i1.p1 TRINITY_DN74447_c0_g1~~TRINITY_DN74447_c0_g1_i1.p1  ORF type:complete len:664 (+),score=106.85 TRINITY_DN74447_c0_g1_i1:74-2065(+)